MNWTPPPSDRPVDIDISLILTSEDAEAAINWLEDKIANMRSQLVNRGEDADDRWKIRVRTAIERTQTTRLRLQNMRGRFKTSEKLARQIRLEEAFMNMVLKHWDSEDVREIWNDVYTTYPELKPA